MTWKPFTELDLWDEINASWCRMTPPQRILWERIRIEPVKWSEASYGDERGGFWVVGLIGNTVIWYNDIEEGFNRSSYTKHGVIDQYLCNDDELNWVVQWLLYELKSGEPCGGSLGPPQPID